ncbi:hypothetical protein H1C71_018070, partial [Ictidomys tridecemlineatus]
PRSFLKRQAQATAQLRVVNKQRLWALGRHGSFCPARAPERQLLGGCGLPGVLQVSLRIRWPHTGLPRTSRKAAVGGQLVQNSSSCQQPDPVLKADRRFP